MLISPKDLAPGENPSQLGVISRPFSPQFHAEPTTFVEKIREAYYARVAAEVAWQVVGVDVSVWQGMMNWELTKPLINYAIIRAGHGGSGDTQLDNNRIGCDKYNIPFGLYWYFVPSIGWLSQARNYAAVYNDGPGKITPVVDIESSGGYSKAEFADMVKKFLDEFEVRTKKKCMIYTSAYFWNTYIGNPIWAKLYKVWVANYTSAAQPAMPVSWSKWTMWQWSNKGNGKAFGAQSTFIDLDRYNGTLEQFNKEFSIEDHEIYVPVVVKMEVSNTSQPYLHIRSAPNLGGKVVGSLLPGMQFNVKDFGGSSCWAQISDGGEFDGNWVCVQLNTTRFCEIVQEEQPSSQR